MHLPGGAEKILLRNKAASKTNEQHKMKIRAEKNRATLVRLTAFGW